MVCELRPYTKARAATDHCHSKMGGRKMTETAKEVTAEYARQVIKVIVPGLKGVDEGSETFFRVNELLKEYGAKAYKQGREHFADQIVKMLKG